MKRVSMILLAVVVLVGTVAVDADAGWLGKKKEKRTEMPEWMKEPVRRDNLPPAHFSMGILGRDSYTGWTVGDLSLVVGPDCVVEQDGVEGVSLQEGRQAIVMGSRVGNTVVAWRVRLLEMDYETGLAKTDVQVERSTVDPTVGRIISAPY